MFVLPSSPSGESGTVGGTSGKESARSLAGVARGARREPGSKGLDTGLDRVCGETKCVKRITVSYLLANNVCPCRHQRGTTSWPSSTHRRSCRWYPGRSIGIPRRTYEGEQPPEINRDWTEPKEKRARELPLKTPQECHGPEPRCKTWQK